MVNAATVRAALAPHLDEDRRAWLAGAEAAAAADPAALAVRFPEVGRRLGRGALLPARPGEPGAAPGPGATLGHWTVDDAGRALLLVAAERPGAARNDAGAGGLAAVLRELYRHGDAAEKRGVLRALDVLDLDGPARDAARDLVADALRTNDLRLIGAALGPFGSAALDDDALAHAVLKCVFVGVPLAAVPGLHARRTPELSRMLAAYVHERIAAGRAVPPEVWPVIDAHPPAAELAAIRAELDSPVPDRREAASAALAGRQEP